MCCVYVCFFFRMMYPLQFLPHRITHQFRRNTLRMDMRLFNEDYKVDKNLLEKKCIDQSF